MTDAQLKVLAQVPRFQDRSCNIGQRVWGQGHTAPRRKSQGYTMTAGRILNQLRAMGLVQWGDYQYVSGANGWRLTVAGREWREQEGGDHAK